MQTKPWNLALAVLLVAALPGAIAVVGCGDASNDRVADSTTHGSTPSVHVESVDVTYYYLPG